jgi:hypothetical protein
LLTVEKFLKKPKGGVLPSFKKKFFQTSKGGSIALFEFFMFFKGGSITNFDFFLAKVFYFYFWRNGPVVSTWLYLSVNGPNRDFFEEYMGEKEKASCVGVWGKKSLNDSCDASFQLSLVVASLKKMLLNSVGHFAGMTVLLVKRIAAPTWFAQNMEGTVNERIDDGIAHSCGKEFFFEVQNWKKQKTPVQFTWKTDQSINQSVASQIGTWNKKTQTHTQRNHWLIDWFWEK